MSIAMHEWPRRHRISVEHYYRMGEVGLFAPDERVELIDGEIVDMPPTGTRHAGKLSRLVKILTEAVGDRGIVRAQLPLRLDDASEPQPDIAIVLPRADFYEQRHPRADRGSNQPSRPLHDPRSWESGDRGSVCSDGERLPGSARKQ